MSKIDELIQELCPDGVVYMAIKDICNAHYGKGNNIPQDGGSIPVYGCAGVVGHTSVSNASNVPLIGHIGSAGKVVWGEGDFYATYNVTICEPKVELITARFLYFSLLKLNPRKFVKGSQPFLSVSDFDKKKIPVPPLEIQEEIVRILDSFTELEKELEKELSLRQKQYEYYREFLFSDISDSYHMSVGDLFDFKNGLNKGKDFFGSGTAIVNFTDVYHGGKLYGALLKGRVEVNQEEICRYSAKRGDVFFTRTSETREEIGISATLVDDIENCVFSGFVLRARPKTELLLPEYCAYCFSTYKVRRFIIRNSNFTTRALTNGGILSKLTIPVPPVEIQKKIADTLDLLSLYVDGVYVGLPAEIEARHKQYEYYRDKLLTFKEKVS